MKKPLTQLCFIQFLNVSILSVQYNTINVELYYTSPIGSILKDLIICQRVSVIAKQLYV